ncbi:MAG TPA: EAL domain-containing protein [Sandaracinaceae bacterium LLY-WYZ-13_1]|nr:EAL domain-containing protein [Sandaracinaceae bacterium LLY-WYZ-13_1]
MSRRRRTFWTLSEADQASLNDDPHSVRSLDAEEIRILFQPIVDVRERRTWAVEALARCTRPHFRDPQALFRAAVEQGATGRLGRLLREVAFDRCAGHRVFVNIHPHELSSRWLVRTDDPLGYHEAGVFLEITETAAFEYFDLCRSVLREVCTRTGAHLVLDDLGAGHSNLARFLELEPEVVKLDRALVRDIDTDRRRQRMVHHLTALFVDLGSEVVAEGIETVDELAAVRDAGVPYGQGYLFARPDYPIPEAAWPGA